MQFLAYDPNWKPGAAQEPPSEEFMAEMGRFIGEAMQSGKLVTTGALPLQGTRLRLADGKFTVTDGPYIELKELTGGFAVINADSVEEAIEWCKRFRKIVGDGETELVPIFGPQ
jgi:hypothetical protein